MQPNKDKWSSYYTLLLVANLVYIIIFYFIMNYFSH